MNRLLCFSLAQFFLALVIAVGSGQVVAQDADKAGASVLTVEDMFRPSELSNVSISRDGKSMAATIPFKGRRNLAVISLETRKAAVLTSYTDFDVIGVRWIGKDKLLFSLGLVNSPTGPGNFDGGGLFVIGRDGSDFRRLSLTVREMLARNDYVFRRLDFFRTIPGTEDEIIAEGNMTASDSRDLYRLNVKTGRYTLITQGRPVDRTTDWIMDSKLVPRVVTSVVKDTLTTVVHYRKDEKSDWYEIARFDSHKGPAFVPLAFESDNKTLQVAYNGGRDTMAVFRYDPENKKMGELIAQHPRYDMGAAANGAGVSGVITDPETDKILGYSVASAKPERVWLDEKYAALQNALDASLPNRINSFRRTPDGKRFLVNSYSDTQPLRLYLFDDEQKTLEQIGSTRPWQEGKLTEQRPFIYKTRDGLEIDGYYFLPKNYKAGTKLPTVVHIHGGPFVRADSWGSGFGVTEAQLFASRGYAVIVPNFRITPGIGSKVYYAGFGTVGRQMSDDHEDALKWGIEQGFVDPTKACISGASYGGYAALQALVRSSEMWKCAVAGLAVTDYEYQLTSRDGDSAENTAGVTYWKYVLGAQDLSSQTIKDISPVFHADKIKRPVFLYAGEDDIRVPIKQIARMNRELARAGNPAKAYVVKEKEGHGFGVMENSVDNWTKILAFLAEHIGK